MRSKIIQGGLAAAFVLALTALGAAPASAGHFTKLSKLHTAQGVSQYVFANVSYNQSAPVKLINPNHVTQLAAMLFYEANRDSASLGTLGFFRGCLVEQLEPHDAIGFSDTDLDAVLGVPAEGDGYVEVIWAPLQNVTVGSTNTRLADGLGGYLERGFSEADVKGIGHPDSFSLPKDSVNPGQKQAAIDCVCAGQTALGTNANKFKDFGITCPAAPPPV